MKYQDFPFKLKKAIVKVEYPITTVANIRRAKIDANLLSAYDSTIEVYGHDTQIEAAFELIKVNNSYFQTIEIQTLQGIAICHRDMYGEQWDFVKPITEITNYYYIINDTMGGSIRIYKDKHSENENDTRDLYTKSCKLIDIDGDVLEVMKDYYKYNYARLIFEQEKVLNEKEQMERI